MTILEAPTGTSGSVERLEDLSLLQDSLHQHQNSVSTLGRTYSVNSADSIQEVELLDQAVVCSAEAAVVEVHGDEVS